MALVTVVVKVVLTRWTGKIGKATQNSAVQALAHDHRNDIFASIGAAAGIYFGRAGHPWVDPLAGALVSLIVLYTGIEILRDSTADLMDTVPGRSLGEKVRKSLAAQDGVKAVEEVRAHRFGPYLVMNLTIGIDGDLSVHDGDVIATEVEKRLIAEIDYLRRVHVHYHPVMYAGQDA